MAKKKLYSLLTENRQSDPEGKLPWYSPVEAMASSMTSSMTFIRGYIACSKGYYPSPDIKIIDYYTKEVIEEIKGNGKVSL